MNIPRIIKYKVEVCLSLTNSSWKLSTQNKYKAVLYPCMLRHGSAWNTHSCPKISAKRPCSGDARIHMWYVTLSKYLNREDHETFKITEIRGKLQLDRTYQTSVGSVKCLGFHSTTVTSKDGTTLVCRSQQPPTQPPNFWMRLSPKSSCTTKTRSTGTFSPRWIRWGQRSLTWSWETSFTIAIQFSVNDSEHVWPPEGALF